MGSSKFQVPSSKAESERREFREFPLIRSVKIDEIPVELLLPLKLSTLNWAQLRSATHVCGNTLTPGLSHPMGEGELKAASRATDVPGRKTTATFSLSHRMARAGVRVWPIRIGGNVKLCPPQL